VPRANHQGTKGTKRISEFKLQISDFEAQSCSYPQSKMIKCGRRAELSEPTATERASPRQNFSLFRSNRLGHRFDLKRTAC
jgi:hypothetical protein